MAKNAVIRLLFSVSLIAIGALMILLHYENIAGKLFSDIGFAFIVAGVLSTFHEGVLRRFEEDETAHSVADKVLNQLNTLTLSTSGIKLVSVIRKGWDGYYQWVTSTKSEDIFFAGRSVLHRIDADFKARRIGKAEELICRKLVEGANVKILFVDPRSDLIPRLAKEEGQSNLRLLSDLAISIGVCLRLYELLKSKNLPSNALLSISVFDEIPYFSYHSVGETVILGFYFSSTLGHQSAAYEIVDPKTKEFFAEHFKSIFSRASATYLLRINPHNSQPELNEWLIDDLQNTIKKVLGEKETEEFIKGEII